MTESEEALKPGSIKDPVNLGFLTSQPPGLPAFQPPQLQADYIKNRQLDFNSIGGVTTNSDLHERHHETPQPGRRV
jgi:hypothetical protein